MDWFNPDPLVRARLRSLEADVEAFIALDSLVYLHNILATVVANHFRQDPVWTLLVGPSSSGKTELLRLPLLLPVAHKASNLRRTGLLSGSIKKGSDEDTGLIFRIGDFGIIVVEDITTLIQSSSDVLGETLALLREIYDGHVVRHFGHSSKDEVKWDGKAGFVGGVTPAVDKCHRLLTTMGDRFLMSRMSVDHDLMVVQGQKAVHRIGVPDDIRQHLAVETRDFLLPITTKLRNAVLPPLPQSLTNRLVAMATLACRLRTVTERGSNGDVIGGYINEMPPRIACQFSSLLYGHLAIGLTLEEAFQAVSHVARSSVPAIRQQVFEHVLASPGAVVDGLADEMRIPKTSANRLITEMYCTRVFDKAGKKLGHFEVSPKLMDLMETIRQPFPDLSLMSSDENIEVGIAGTIELGGDPAILNIDEPYMTLQHIHTEADSRIPEISEALESHDMDAVKTLTEIEEFNPCCTAENRSLKKDSTPQATLSAGDQKQTSGKLSRPLKPGMRAGRWTILEDDPMKNHGKVLCQCDCGTQRQVSVANLSSGLSTGCGCGRPRLKRKADKKGENEETGAVTHPVMRADAKNRRALQKYSAMNE